MTDEKKPAEPKPAEGNSHSSAPKITRRRFTKAGVVAPVIMTLGSRPVWGDTSNSSAVGSDAGSLDMATSELRKVASTSENWLSAARTASWPSSKDYPDFTATSSDTFETHFPQPLALDECAEDDVKKLLRQSLSVVLFGSDVTNKKLALLAKEAAAARLNALLSDALESKFNATQDLFPVSPGDVVDAFWTAVHTDCASLGTVSTTTLSVASRAKKSPPKQPGTSCSGYESGLAMNVQALEFGDLNSDGTSLL